MRPFRSLSEQEVLALAITLEEEDARIYADLAAGLKAQHPEMAEKFRALQAEEDGHRHRLINVYKQKFGDHIPLIRRHDIKGFVQREGVHGKPVTPEDARHRVETMECETRGFYEAAAERATDASIRQLLGDLAQEERKHEHTAEAIPIPEEEHEAEARRRLFVLQVIQPGLAGLMDGSVSTLAPLFATAFATRTEPNGTWVTFLVGLAASVGAGISMGFAEGLSDDGSLDRTRPAADPRHRLWRDDRPRGTRPHDAVLDPPFLDRHHGRDFCRHDRARRDLVDPPTVHGHAVALGSISGRARGLARLHRRHPNRQLVIP